MKWHPARRVREVCSYVGKTCNVPKLWIKILNKSKNKQPGGNSSKIKHEAKIDTYTPSYPAMREYVLKRQKFIGKYL